MSVFIYEIYVLIVNLIVSIILLIISFVLTILVIREFRRMNRTLEDSLRKAVDSRQGEKDLTRTMIAVID